MSGREEESAGLALRRLRLAKGWTLADLAERADMPVSSLSKLELGQTGLSYDKLLRLCRALSVNPDQFMRQAADPAPDPRRREVTRSGRAPTARMGPHRVELGAQALASKAFAPVVVEVRARGLARHGPLQAFSGDVYLHVLEGEVALHFDYDKPVLLAPGDSVYFDGRAKHAILAADQGLTRVLMILPPGEPIPDPG